MGIFDPDVPQWLVQNQRGGQYGTLEDCLAVFFDHIPAQKIPVSYSAIKNRCEDIGYVSIHGWTLCFITNDGEYTIG
ncbi:hypothetical protein [Pseudanabaena sp. PCC 6802]|uniref:hypothetical protein n=1 Tax=Pseudanabaena sp. PCC 6802 TaxID=118173 RepID=UPI0003476A48|nr:hypothetical protein [Pseudanabaena sp. PCC 6802]